MNFNDQNERSSSVSSKLTIMVKTPTQSQFEGDMVLIATGREPCMKGLDLEKARVEYSPEGIKVILMA